MLRGILGVLRRDHMRNNNIRRILQLSGTMSYSGRLRWFGNVQRRYENTVTRRAMDLAIPGIRRRGRPRRHMAPTDQGRPDGCGCYPGYEPRPEGVEKDKTDP